MGMVLYVVVRRRSCSVASLFVRFVLFCLSGSFSLEKTKKEEVFYKE